MESAAYREPQPTPRVQRDDRSPDRTAAEGSASAETDLIRRAQRGDADAFGALVERFQDRLYNTMYRMTHHHADALDLTQTALLKAWRALPRFDGRAGFYTWLFRIAMNLATSRYRSRGRRTTVSLSETGPGALRDAPGAGEGPADAMLRAESEQRLARALGELGEEYRAAVVLKDVEDLDYATIAKILDVPIGTVRSRIHRGRALLRDLLTREEPHGDAGG